MKVAIYTDMLSLHQIHLADELYILCGENFRFFEMRKIADAEKAFYVKSSSRPYLVKVWEDEKSKKEAMDWAITADVARFSSNSFEFPYLKARLDKNLLTFEAGERWLKRGWLNILSSNLIKNLWYYHTQYKNKPFYKLCCSAYCANDQYLFHTFMGRCYKWGYFTNVDDYGDETLINTNRPDRPSLMWCARFLKWKHPEMVIQLAHRLKLNNYDVQIDMFGAGEEMTKIKALAKELGVDKMVMFKGNAPNEEIIRAMHQHDIFLFTSDRNEGWGAVLNEAMSNGCAVVASNEIGAVPFLVRDGVNGMGFQSRDLNSLYEKVVFLIDHPLVRKDLALKAYQTMKNVWSPKQAASNFLHLSKDLLDGRETSIKEGPCSRALPIY